MLITHDVNQPQVPFCVLFKSEQNNADMLDILKVHCTVLQSKTYEVQSRLLFSCGGREQRICVAMLIPRKH